MTLSPDKERLKERQLVRLQILKAMFDSTVEAKNDPERTYFSPRSLAAALELKIIDVQLALNYLEGQYLITCSTKMADPEASHYKLNHSGILEIEQAIEHDDRATPHFMLQVVQHFHAQVANVQNGPDSTATLTQVLPNHE